MGTVEIKSEGGTRVLEPEHLKDSHFSKESVRILRALSDRGEGNTLDLRREAAVERHHWDTRMSADDGLLVKADLVERVGVDHDSQHTGQPPTMWRVTPRLCYAVREGLLGGETSSSTVVMDRETVEELVETVDVLESEVERLTDELAQVDPSTGTSDEGVSEDELRDLNERLEQVEEYCKGQSGYIQSLNPRIKRLEAQVDD